MMKHQRVHMAPVAMRAAFCDSERTSAGRAKSAAPARTTPHCEDDELAHVLPSHLDLLFLFDNPIPYNLLHFDELLLHTFMIGALYSSPVSIFLHSRTQLLYTPWERMTHQKCTVLGPTSEFHSCVNRD